MANRFFVSVPQGVLRISQPGVDAKNPPALNEDNLLFSSEWPNTERLHAVISTHILNFQAFGTVIDYPFPALGLPPVVSARYFDFSTGQEVAAIPWSYNEYLTGAFRTINFLNIVAFRNRVRVLAPGSGPYAAVGSIPNNYMAQIMVYKP